MKRTLLFFLLIFALGYLFSCGTQSSSLETSLKDKNIHVINFRDFTLYLDFILGTDNNKNSGFRNPSSVALDSLKNIYVADKGNNRIQVYSRTGKYMRTIDDEMVKELRGLDVYSVDIDKEDNIYVSAGNRRRRIKKILILSSNGELIDFFNTKFMPGKLSLYKNSIYIHQLLDSTEYLVHQCSKSGEIIKSYDKGLGASLVKKNASISVDYRGNIYIAYEFFPTVREYSPEGKRLLEFEYEPSIKNKKPPHQTISESMARTSDPSQVLYSVEMKSFPVCYDTAVDKNGMIYLLVAVNHDKDELCSLYKFDPSGKLEQKVALPIYCGRLFIDSSSNFYFLSDITNLVYKYSYISNTFE